MSVRWHGGAEIRRVRSKAAVKLDAAARAVAGETKKLLDVKGTGKRASASRRVKKWIALEKYSAADDMLRARRVYKLGRGGKLKAKTQVWTGKTVRLRQGAKTLGAERAAAGQAPRKQTGRLRASIRVTSRGKLTRKIGTHVFYGKILEPTHPFLLPGLELSKAKVASLF